MADSSGGARSALQECEEMSLLIEINSETLERMRNNSSRSGGGGPVSELTRQEIRTMEGKLVKNFSKQARPFAGIIHAHTHHISQISSLQLHPHVPNFQLALRTRWCSPAAMAEPEEAASVAREIAANYPSLPVFLVVAGISPEAKAAVLARVATLEALKEIKTDSGEWIISLFVS